MSYLGSFEQQYRLLYHVRIYILSLQTRTLPWLDTFFSGQRQMRFPSLALQSQTGGMAVGLVQSCYGALSKWAR